MKVYKGLRDIAELFGVSPRTIQRWVADRGLPVAKTPKGSYITTSDNISQWILVTGQKQKDAGELPR
jgi:predicted site-specific integrase-resolvase